MAEPHVISALVSKYSETLGQIKACEEEADRHKEALVHLEATIRLFREDADLDLIKPRMPRNRNPWFKKGQCVQSALTVLRESDTPMTAREIALRLLADKGIKNANTRSVKFLTNTVRGALCHRKDGIVQHHANSYPQKWSID